MVEVQKLEVFCDSRGDRPKARVFLFFSISDLRARPSTGIGVVEVQKLEVLPARPSAGIGVVQVQKLVFFFFFCFFFFVFAVRG